MKKLKDLVLFLLLVYVFGVMIGMIFWLLRFIGILRVKGWSNFPHWKQKVLVVSNHPYKGEQFLLIGLFFHQYFFRPFRHGPWSLADRKNYYDKPRYRFMRPRLIPVDRTLSGGDARSLRIARKIFASRRNIIAFPEGGRTDKGDFFLYSQSGKRIRPLKGGFTILAAEPEAIVVPVWFEFDNWSSMRLTIGESISFTGVSREEVVERTEKILLELADTTD